MSVNSVLQADRFQSMSDDQRKQHGIEPALRCPVHNGVEYTVGASIAFDSSRPAGERFHWNVIEGDHH